VQFGAAFMRSVWAFTVAFAHDNTAEPVFDHLFICVRSLRLSASH